MTDKIRIFDGAQGTLLTCGHCAGHASPAMLNITDPERVQRMHSDYADAGAQYITVNSFELNPLKWAGHDVSWQQVADAAIDNARKAVHGRASIMFDVSTSGQLMEPVGQLTFQQAYDNFRQVAEYVKDRVDGFILETFSDLYELRAAILAIRDCCSSPLFATMTFDERCLTLTGSSPEIVALTLSSLGVDALGVNCSVNPGLVVEVVRRMKPFASCPILAQPNKGLPRMNDGIVEYDWSDEEFLENARRLVDAGASIIGGCCGTSASTIRAISVLKELPAPAISKPDGVYICSSTVLLELGKGRVCGERLNPTGKKKLKEALAKCDFGYLQNEALAQKDAGADYLDLNCGIPDTDEKALLTQAVRSIQAVCYLPLQLDSSNTDAINEAIRVYNGVPMINSVNGSEASMERLLPVIARFNTPAVALPLDDNGVPASCDGRVAIAQKIIERAAVLGIDRRMLVFDGLVMAVSSDQSYGRVTLDTLAALKEMGVMTTIGLSNVSFGLPERAVLNRSFLAMALAGGLDMPIMNPLDHDTMAVMRASIALTGFDNGCRDYIGFSTPAAETDKEDNLYNAVLQGLKDHIQPCVEQELARHGDSDSIINGILIPALTETGDRFSRGELFMPQLIRSAESAKLAFSILDSKRGTAAGVTSSNGTLVLATVRGDVHDIGKNIVKVVVQSHGFNVVDLGRDVPKEVVLKAASDCNPMAIGLSALMTTTVDSMKETIAFLRQNGIECPVVVGGAVLTDDIARSIGATHYAQDALETAHYMQHLSVRILRE